jgi:Microcystin-dependent protein
MDSYLGEIRIFPFNIVPNGWSACDGKILNIRQYQALYALLGNKYGGDGINTFALPDLRGRTLVGYNPAVTEYGMGAKGGAENIALTTNNIPSHNHEMEVANSAGNANIPTNRIAIPNSATSSLSGNLYSTDTQNSVPLGAAMLDPAGGNAAHNNMQPFLAQNYCIAIMGTYPPRQ